MQIYEELKARGLIAQVTDEDEIRELVNNGKATFYIGFDCTADSLHVGHFMALCLMKRLQMAGNKPIALIGVVVDVLLGEHLAHVRAAGGVADHGRAAADEGDGLVSGLLQALHQRQGHEVTGGQAVRRAVKANIEGGLAGVHHFADLIFVCHLGDQTPGDQFFVNTH